MNGYLAQLFDLMVGLVVYSLAMLMALYTGALITPGVTIVFMDANPLFSCLVVFSAIVATTCLINIYLLKSFGTTAGRYLFRVNRCDQLDCLNRTH